MWYIGFCYNCGKPVAFFESQKTVLCRRCFKRLDCKKLLKSKKMPVKSVSQVPLLIQRINEGKLDIP